ncbi:MAG: hypothetical protein CO029_03310 [Candidatus Magasanikbacteria bacterium CG_4_9_14_0_2_um_filter_41_10]|uniref:Uncharacterized protein n=1 Tax=Candidatus Magasanikbacteria bacterium CG_4_10_14_0_2_um_filter_41_31 TaxID=1974639 RepID=A0A2M7V4S3_9BACT|nr:MAG: hypothetical protein AUJ37_04510 [Candidatus Magasanikbacteria bacterium CG1_02_41_34]PIZ93560.1 MAG: hypothetical protein COX83_01690 [Candidatus Magasanikbacteria bacterium CG_4_10_14_0_2_um_filter_41_31]PJC53312.1 MAG: hypothetical protein CO029_03310 [Candidatus Magasanikbacteria bacterium CG_4_9_14_0_2_um_filter_41_10]
MKKSINNKSKQKTKFVINPLSPDELQSFLDEKSKKIIKYFLIKSLFSQPEPKKEQKTLPIQIPKEHIEQWFTQSLDVKPVGAGSYPIDIYNEREKWGADIKMLNIKLDSSGSVTNGDSGEASLGQKFEGPGINLDEMFKKKKYTDIKNQWVKLFNEKYESLKKNYPIETIYYFFILRPGTQIEGADFYFTGAVINLKNLEEVEVDKKRTTTKSVFLKNFIDDAYGGTKIYKAKKRLELRLRPKTWIENGMSLKITTSFIPTHINLREQDIGPDYLKNEIDKLKNLEVNFVE